MAHPNEELVRGGVAAFQRGDLDALRENYFAADIRWHVPGRGPLSGTYEGVDQVIGFFARIFEMTDGTYRVELHDALGNDEHAIVLFTQRGERDGKQFTDDGVLVHHIKDGKVTETWTHPTDLYGQDEFLA